MLRASKNVVISHDLENSQYEVKIAAKIRLIILSKCSGKEKIKAWYPELSKELLKLLFNALITEYYNGYRRTYQT